MRGYLAGSVSGVIVAGTGLVAASLLAPLKQVPMSNVQPEVLTTATAMPVLQAATLPQVSFAAAVHPAKSAVVSLIADAVTPSLPAVAGLPAIVAQAEQAEGTVAPQIPTYGGGAPLAQVAISEVLPVVPAVLVTPGTFSSPVVLAQATPEGAAPVTNETPAPLPEVIADDQVAPAPPAPTTGFDGAVADSPSAEPSTPPLPNIPKPPAQEGVVPEVAQISTQLIAQNAQEQQQESEPPKVHRGTEIGEDAGVVIRRPGTEDEAATQEATASGEQPATLRFATPFENPDDTPIISFVILDSIIQGLGPNDVSRLPFPVTIAIDPNSEDAMGRMTAYRDKGIEVMALARLPVAASPTDMEIALEGTFGQITDAVALLDTGEVGLGSDRATILQTLDWLSRDGRGLVSLSSGLNAAQRMAAREGVPAAPVYRDLDGSGEAERTIIRFVEQAAFRTRQQGQGVVMLGRLKPNTLRALIRWAERNDETQVRVAPVSAVLNGQDAE